METKRRSINQIIEEQVRRWQLVHSERVGKPELPVITVSREPGSGGNLVAARIAEKCGLDLFHQEVVHEMAISAQAEPRILESLDEKRLSTLEDWISSLIHRRHIWPDEYLKHLMKVVGTIGKHGKAVIVGRGANFILPPEKRFRVRVIAPQKDRISNVAREFNVPMKDAKRRVIKTESQRIAFIRKYFNADISDPLNYDLIINTKTCSLDAVGGAVCGMLKHWLHP
ncbi:MAG: cytidylate kinase-like family protein [Deltaproteobacteria bacterium]|nr:cytidylate kinase-like family protein [Deltaproteobacteria bacterium]